MKNKACFLGAKNQINRVYRDIKPLLEAELEFPAEVINLENIGKYKEFAENCKYIFSTWGMICGAADYFKNCEVVFYGAGSVQYFAREYLERGIKVSSSWVANGVPVAEVTVSQIILAAKGFFRIMGKVKSREGWQSAGRLVNENFKGNYNQKIGILGAGTIGRRVIDYLKRIELNAEILVYDPFYSETAAKAAGVRKAELEEIFKTCGIISNHTANLPSTAGLINKTHFSKMQDHSTFINTGRGAQVSEKDLTDALKNNPSLTAVLDVTDPEPPEAGSELYSLDNVILTPHIAGCVGDEVLRMAEYMYAEYKLYDGTGKLEYEITADMLEYMA
ncbi:MAG: hydroxyacid dehydrogenase [Oscillospiraceae bacterium]|nr:hydroxyacid dehydrogenase [Oscillospiraceae bacterium]